VQQSKPSTRSEKRGCKWRFDGLAHANSGRLQELRHIREVLVEPNENRVAAEIFNLFYVSRYVLRFQDGFHLRCGDWWCEISRYDIHAIAEKEWRIAKRIVPVYVGEEIGNICDEPGVVCDGVAGGMKKLESDIASTWRSSDFTTDANGAMRSISEE